MQTLLPVSHFNKNDVFFGWCLVVLCIIITNFVFVYVSNSYFKFLFDSKTFSFCFSSSSVNWYNNFTIVSFLHYFNIIHIYFIPSFQIISHSSRVLLHCVYLFLVHDTLIFIYKKHDFLIFTFSFISIYVSIVIYYTIKYSQYLEVIITNLVLCSCY